MNHSPALDALEAEWADALDRLEHDVERYEAAVDDPASLSGFFAGRAWLPTIHGPLPESLGSRARGLLARFDHCEQRMAEIQMHRRLELGTVAGAPQAPIARYIDAAL